jgi:ATP-dependent Lon protease
MTSLLLVPLDDTVVFPTMDVTLPVRVGDEERVLLVPRHEGEFAKVGTIAEVTDHIRLPGGGRAVFPASPAVSRAPPTPTRPAA